MNTDEIIKKMTSRDTDQVWSAANEIISLGQDRDRILPLIPFLPSIIEKTKGLEMGGLYAPNSRFIDQAIRTLEFHRDSKECSCRLYEMNGLSPEREVSRGNIKILETVKTAEGYVDFYKVECNLCQRHFKVIERESHYMWWGWSVWE